MVGEPSCAICRWAKSGTSENRPNKAGAVPPISFLRPLPLCREAQALTHRLKGGRWRPPPYKPRDDPLGLCAEVGAKERLSSELSMRITDQDPTHRHGGHARGVPEGGVRDHLHRTPSLPYHRATTTLLHC